MYGNLFRAHIAGIPVRTVFRPGAGVLPEVSWGIDYHTSVPVPLCAVGPRAELFVALNDNVQAFETMVSVLALAVP